MRSCVKYLKNFVSLFLVVCCFFIASKYTFRVRLHSGRMVRISLQDDCTFADLHAVIDRSGYFLDGNTDTVQFTVGSGLGSILRSNYTKLSASRIESGEVLRLQSAHSQPAKQHQQKIRPVRSVAATIRKKAGMKNFASLDDLKKRRSRMQRIVSSMAERDSTTVHISKDAVRAALARMPAGVNSSLLDMCGGVALLLGTRRNNSVHVHGAVEVSRPAACSLADQSAAAFIARQTVRMARLLGLQVVGCAVGSGSSAVAARHLVRRPAPARPAWSAEHVRAALFLRDQCISYDGNCSAQVDPFVIIR
jgi:hypothetical protein